MKVVYWSDLHCETFPNYLPFDINEVPEADILILAGDIGVISAPESIITILQYVEHKFDHILLLAGNHEYWHGLYDPERLKALVITSGLDHKVHVFSEDNRLFRLEHVSFIGATLWTDYDNGNPMTRIIANQSMVDFRVTATRDVSGFRMLTPEDVLNIHRKELEEVYVAIDDAHDRGDIVVVATHHAPSYQSIPARFKNDSLNGAFASDINTYGADYWIHGHVHNSFDYVNEHGTRVLANPHGYNQDFNVEFAIDKYLKF